MSMTLKLIVAALAVLCVSGAAAATADQAHAKPKEAQKAQMLAYAPPMRGAPLSRIGGGTRSIQARDLEVQVLAPDHTGLTLKSQPVLYWYASKEITAQVEFTIVRPNVADPVLEVTLPGPFKPGIHAIPLQQLGAALDEEVAYEWFVSVVFDPAQRSSDVTAGAGIRLVGAGDAVRARFTGEEAKAAVEDYAAAGIWYDAISNLSEKLASNPADGLAASQRADLLRQVGLAAAAGAD